MIRQLIQRICTASRSKPSSKRVVTRSALEEVIKYCGVYELTV